MDILAPGLKETLGQSQTSLTTAINVVMNLFVGFGVMKETTNPG